MNLYFTSPTDVQAVTRARSADLNILDASVDAAFDKLPTEDELKLGKTNYAVDTGVADAFVVALPHAPASYVDGLEVCFKPLFSNSGACTIDVNALGVKSIVNPDGTAPSAGAIVINGFAQLRYNTSLGMFVLMNPATINTGVGSFATLAGVETLSNKTLSAPVINNAVFNNATFATQAPNDNSTKAATTAYADAADALKANLASPALTGNPTAPTQAPGTNNTRLATTAYADAIAAAKANIASPSFTGIVSDADGALRGIPQNVQNTGYQLVLGDAGKHLIKTDGTARTHTVPPNATVAFPLGTAITFVNLGGSANNLTIARGAGVAIFRAGTDANITVTPGDMVSLIKVGTDAWQA